MKALKYVGVVLLIGAAFVLGRNFDSLFTKTVDVDQIVIDQEWHDWEVHRDRSDRPVTIQLFIRNQSKTLIDSTVRFKVELDSSALEAKFIDALISITDEFRFLENHGGNPRSKAIASYVKRGKTLADGDDHEPILNPDLENYTTVISSYVHLRPGESTKLEFEAVIPPAHRGHALSISLIDS